MKIKTPNVIKVAGIDIKILDYPEGVADARNRYGEYNSRYQFIHIDLNYSSIQVLTTLLHELNHAIFNLYHIVDQDEEEDIVTVLGIAWAQVYRDNPDLIKFITKSVKGK